MKKKGDTESFRICSPTMTKQVFEIKISAKKEKRKQQSKVKEMNALAAVPDVRDEIYHECETEQIPIRNE